MTAVSVIVTVLNEAESLPELLASLERQTHTPDEVVIIDAGSSDGTWEQLRSYHGPLKLEIAQLPGCTIARGRNAGIAHAHHENIAVTDAGVVLSDGWLAALMRPFAADPSTQAVAGFFEAAPRSVFELALGATTLPRVDEISPERFLPSSRSVAFTRQAWERAAGYPEWLDYCEDLVFDLRLLEQGVRFTWAPDALVYFRPRPTLREFFRQYYRYARGDGKADLWLKRHLTRYGAYLFAVAAVASVQPVLWLALLVGGMGYLVRPYSRLIVVPLNRPAIQVLGAIYLVPLIRLVGDVAKMVGYPAGVWWRLRSGQAHQKLRPPAHT